MALGVFTEISFGAIRTRSPDGGEEIRSAANRSTRASSQQRTILLVQLDNIFMPVALKHLVHSPQRCNAGEEGARDATERREQELVQDVANESRAQNSQDSDKEEP